MRAYYNEIDPAAAHVLRALITDGVIAPGDVDTRSIKEVCPDDLDGYTQCHFFAGFGGWSIAARMAGWPDDRPLWSGSCPCQPFSVAGKGAGTADVRHLWPDFHRIIRAARPACVVGEQVARTAGYGWFDGVAANLAGEGYASRCVDIPACAVDAPHIRQRLYWCAVAVGHRARLAVRKGDDRVSPGARCTPTRQVAGRCADEIGRSASPANMRGDVADCPSNGRQQRRVAAAPTRYWGKPAAADSSSMRGAVSFWSDAEWLACHDGKARRAKPGLRLLVDGMPGRIDAWRLAGNGIVLPLAAEVIAALIDVMPEWRAAA